MEELVEGKVYYPLGALCSYLIERDAKGGAGLKVLIGVESQLWLR
jgi:hypothetical protein